MAMGKMTVVRRTKKQTKTLSKSQVQRMIQGNLETKQHSQGWTTPVTVGTPGIGGFHQVLTGVAQGDTQNLRDGNQITVTGIHSRWVITNADSTNLVRVVFYMPKNVDDQVLDSIVGIIDQDKYNVLYDKLIPVNSSHQQVLINFNRKFNKGSRKGIRCVFNGASNTQYTDNVIKLYIISDSAASSHPTVQGSHITYFKDA